MFLFSVRLASSPMLILDNTGPNTDLDGTPTDDNAILLEDMAYRFQCNFAADTVNPHPSIRWDLYNSAGALQDSRVDPGQDQTCPAPALSRVYDLTAARVTFAGLQCGFLVCTAYTDDVPLVAGNNPFDNSNPWKDRITFQIWSKYMSLPTKFYFCELMFLYECSYTCCRRHQK